MLSTRFYALASLLSVLASVRAYHWPSPQYDQLEALLYEKYTEEGSRSMTGPLNNCQPQNTTTNENAAANWLRMAFHDMATHNVDDGTGGMDSSIYFELGYRGNVGKGMTDTMQNFASYPTKYVSKADVLAMSVPLLTAECDGPIIPYRGGRIDVYWPAPDTAPLPFDTLDVHLEKFRREGFNREDMIGLVACGHTVGGVRNPDFPTISPPGPEVDYVALFDPTTKFDNLVVTQYLDGTTKNALVKNSNVTVSSDLRVYTSDNNVTMQKLADPAVFNSTCGDLLGRMIHTVAKNITLGDEIKLLPAKVAGVQLSPGSKDALTLKASFRLLSKNTKRKVTMLWANADGKACSSRLSCSAQPVRVLDTTTALTSRAGHSPQKYFFAAPIKAESSISKFWFEVDEGNGKKTVYDNNGTGYQITQDKVLYVPEKSTNHDEKTFDIVVAARNDKLPSRVYAHVYQRITTYPSDTTVEFALDKTIKSVAGYSFYKATIPGPHFTFDLFSVVNGKTYSEDARDTYFI